MKQHMAWNEPGGDKKDPWGGGGNDQGPPDLDEVVKKMQDRLGGLFGGRKGGGSGGSPRGGRSGGAGPIVFIAGVLLLVAALVDAFYIVGPDERGVVYQFGAFENVTGPGWHFRAPWPIQSHDTVNVDAVETFTHKAEMLTKDENIVDLELTVQYRIENPDDFLFNVRDPRGTLRDITETAVRTVIGNNNLDYIITAGRGALKAEIQERIQVLVDIYAAGLRVTSVNTQPAKPPEQVKSAFDDVIKAREDKERVTNEATAYANQVVPEARGTAARLKEESLAYREQVIARAEGESNRFEALLREYQKAPEVTRQRLYLEAMEAVLQNTDKVVLDTKSGNNLLYLPLDGGQAAGSGGAPAVRRLPPVPPQLVQPDRSLRETSRGREVRR